MLNNIPLNQSFAAPAKNLAALSMPTSLRESSATPWRAAVAKASQA